MSLAGFHQRVLQFGALGRVLAGHIFLEDNGNGMPVSSDNFQRVICRRRGNRLEKTNQVIADIADQRKMEY